MTRSLVGVVDMLIGALLWLGAAAKLVTELSKGMQSDVSIYVLTGLLVYFEVMLGGLLVTKQARADRTVFWAIVCLFMGFGVWQLALVMSNVRSCGCFGDVHVPPWLMAGVDFAIVAFMLTTGCERKDKSNVVRSHFNRPARYIAAVAFGITMGFIGMSSPAARLSDDERELQHSPIWILRPPLQVDQSIIGSRLDFELLLGKGDWSSRYGTGRWLVVLVRQECSECSNSR